MSVRSTESLVTFEEAFKLSDLESRQPPGTYRLVVDDEEIDGLSFIAYRRTATMLHLPAIEISALPREVIHIDPEELAAVISADASAQSEHHKT